MEKGSVILVKNFEFRDGTLDLEGYKRKCIVLFDEEREDGKYYWVVPVVEQVSAFNKQPERYTLLPLTNRNGKKLLFAKLSNIQPINENEVIEQIDWLDLNTIKRMLEKIRNNYYLYEEIEYYESALNIMEERNGRVK